MVFSVNFLMSKGVHLSTTNFFSKNLLGISLGLHNKRSFALDFSHSWGALKSFLPLLFEYLVCSRRLLVLDFEEVRGCRSEIIENFEDVGFFIDLYEREWFPGGLTNFVTNNNIFEYYQEEIYFRLKARFPLDIYYFQKVVFGFPELLVCFDFTIFFYAVMEAFRLRLPNFVIGGMALVPRGCTYFSLYGPGAERDCFFPMIEKFIYFAYWKRVWNYKSFLFQKMLFYEKLKLWSGVYLKSVFRIDRIFARVLLYFDKLVGCRGLQKKKFDFFLIYRLVVLLQEFQAGEGSFDFFTIFNFYRDDMVNCVKYRRQKESVRAERLIRRATEACLSGFSAYLPDDWSMRARRRLFLLNSHQSVSSLKFYLYRVYSSLSNEYLIFKKFLLLKLRCYDIARLESFRVGLDALLSGYLLDYEVLERQYSRLFLLYGKFERCLAVLKKNKEDGDYLFQQIMENKVDPKKFTKLYFELYHRYHGKVPKEVHDIYVETVGHPLSGLRVKEKRGRSWDLKLGPNLFEFVGRVLFFFLKIGDLTDYNRFNLRSVLYNILFDNEVFGSYYEAFMHSDFRKIKFLRNFFLLNGSSLPAKIRSARFLFFMRRKKLIMRGIFLGDFIYDIGKDFFLYLENLKKTSSLPFSFHLKVLNYKFFKCVNLGLIGRGVDIIAPQVNFKQVNRCNNEAQASVNVGSNFVLVKNLQKLDWFYHFAYQRKLLHPELAKEDLSAFNFEVMGRGRRDPFRYKRFWTAIRRKLVCNAVRRVQGVGVFLKLIKWLMLGFRDEKRLKFKTFLNFGVCKFAYMCLKVFFFLQKRADFFLFYLVLLVFNVTDFITNSFIFFEYSIVILLLGLVVTLAQVWGCYRRVSSIGLKLNAWMGRHVSGVVDCLGFCFLSEFKHVMFKLGSFFFARRSLVVLYLNFWFYKSFFFDFFLALPGSVLSIQDQNRLDYSVVVNGGGVLYVNFSNFQNFVFNYYLCFWGKLFFCGCFSFFYNFFLESIQFYFTKVISRDLFSFQRLHVLLGALKNRWFFLKPRVLMRYYLNVMWERLSLANSTHVLYRRYCRDVLEIEHILYFFDQKDIMELVPHLFIARVNGTEYKLTRKTGIYLMRTYGKEKWLDVQPRLSLGKKRRFHFGFFNDFFDDNRRYDVNKRKHWYLKSRRAQRNLRFFGKWFDRRCDLGYVMRRCRYSKRRTVFLG